MANDKKLYEFIEDGWFDGMFYKAGDRERFHSRQAQHNLHRMKEVTAAKSKSKSQAKVTEKPNA